MEVRATWKGITFLSKDLERLIESKNHAMLIIPRKDLTQPGVAPP